MLRSNLVILHLTHTIYTNYYSSSYQLKYEYSLDQQQIELREEEYSVNAILLSTLSPSRFKNDNKYKSRCKFFNKGLLKRGLDWILFLRSSSLWKQIEVILQCRKPFSKFNLFQICLSISFSRSFKHVALFRLCPSFIPLFPFLVDLDKLIVTYKRISIHVTFLFYSAISNN